jgi:DNA-binding MarR family transcriptional regulator
MCRMHRRNRTVGSAYDTSLSPMESTALPEIAASPGLLVGELQERLHLDQVATSRLVHSLRSRSLLREERPTGDKRRKELYVTEKGAKELGTSAARAYATFASAIERVPHKDRTHFLTLFAVFNDGLGAREAAMLSSDPEGMREVRRLSRALGALGSSAFNQPCSPLEWHLFDLLHSASLPPTMSALADSLGSPTQTVIAMIKRLCDAALLQVKEDSRDRRCKTVLLTPSGLALYLSRRKLAEELLGEGLRRIEVAERSRFLELFSAWSGDALPDSITVLSPFLQIDRTHSEDELSQLRAFVMWERCRQGLYTTHSSSLLARSDAIYSVRLHGRLICLACISPSESSDTTGAISHLLCIDESEILSHATAAIAILIDQVCVAAGYTALLADAGDVSVAVRPALFSLSIVRPSHLFTPAKRGRGTQVG